MSTIKLTPSQIQTKTEELSGSETEFEEDSDATTLDSLYPIINESQTTIIVPDQQQQSQATQKIETNKRRRASDLPQKYAERKMSTQKQINKSLTPKPRGRRATSSNSSFQKQDKPQKEEEKLLFKDFTFGMLFILYNFIFISINININIFVSLYSNYTIKIPSV